MKNDYQKKAPTKTERMLLDLAVFQQNMENNLFSTSQMTIVLGILGKLEPEEVAQLMVNGQDKIRGFTVRLNNKMKELVKEKQPPPPEPPKLEEPKK